MNYTLLDNDGDTHEYQGSGKKPYLLKNVGGVISCSCPAWRNQSKPIDLRTCKHIIAVRGVEVERIRVDNDSLVTGKNDTAPEKVAPPVALGNNWDGEATKGRWASEKLDGVRCYLHDGKLVSRNGNLFQAPDWYLNDLPNATLDGELWMRRGSFQDVVSVVRQKNAGDKWMDVFYMVFDFPNMDAIWLDRQHALEKLAERHAPLGDVPRLGARTFLLPQTEILNEGHMLQLLGQVLEKGGEGLMLANPMGTYVPGRTSNLLKVKQFKTGLAMVSGYSAGKGRHVGVVGALEVVDVITGTTFSVGSGLTDAQRKQPPLIGTTIEYRFFELTPDGNPRFPTFVKSTS